MIGVTKVEVQRYREAQRILEKIDNLLSKIGIKLGLGFLAVCSIIGVFIMR